MDRETPPLPDANADAVGPLDSFDVVEKSIDELQQAQATGAITARDLVRLYTARIAAYDQAGPAINSVIALNPNALADAFALDLERRDAGPRGPLHGIPVLVKDNFDTVDMPTTGGALAFAALVPTSDASLVRRLRRAGAVILGKTTMHELAAGITNVSSLTGASRNPYHLGCVPGGSSGGSGAAVAASFAAAALGSDTSGSIRIPAANQNLVGLRATFGLISRAGMMPLCASQDMPGPLARTVEDLAIMLDATVGEDSSDPATLGVAQHVPLSYQEALRSGALAGRRIGVLRDLFGKAQEDEEVGQVVQGALNAMQARGAVLVDLHAPSIAAKLPDSSLVLHEFKFVLADYLAQHAGAPVHSLSEIITRGLHHRQLDELLRLRDAPTRRDTDAYREALALRRTLLESTLAIFDTRGLDVIAYPTLQREPARLGQAQAGANSQLSASTGLPAISFPAGFTGNGVPVGIEFLGRAHSEALLLALAFDWEQMARLRHPPFSTPPLVRGLAPRRRIGKARLPLPVAKDSEELLDVEFTYESHTGRLDIGLALKAEDYVEDLFAITLQQHLSGQPGPILHHIGRTGQPMPWRMALELQAPERTALMHGELYVHVYSRHHPLGANRAALRFETHDQDVCQ